MVERTMATETDYIANLKELVCGNDSSQVQNLVERVIRREYLVDNGTRPNGMVHGTGRFGALQDVSPKHQSKSIDDGSSSLLPSQDEKGKVLNNNPNYRPNMIEVLNTPFDHIERIVLQDLSDVMFNGDGNSEFNLFKNGLTLHPDDHGGVRGFSVDADATWCGLKNIANSRNFADFNNAFSRANNQAKGGFFIDSFTYTPFVDYSQADEGGDPRVGVYSDQFLTDYNTQKYDLNPDENQIDKNRQQMSSKLYELGNLKKDLEDAKVAFRDAITYQDGNEEKTYQVYIYTLCEHLATLFAKLSNIRMSHEIYGFKHPHAQWEGILALDVWYNLLYREIDAKYPFDDKFMNMNPMQRRPVVRATKNYVVMDDGRKLFLNSDSSCAWDNNGGQPIAADGLEWMWDETSSEFVYIWDANLWEEYYDNSQKITETRKECTTPRGVLKKIYHIVKGFEYKWESYLG